MKFLSVCSGIEAASVAWQPLGWKAVAFSEIEPFPCALLKHHYPDTPNWGDMNNFKDWPDVSIDLLCGGTPCQSFSVAGLRKGLDDPRGNLMLTFGAIAAKYRPKWLVWENVPGVLSSNGGKDFTSFLDMLEELGYVCDIEILDAQYFGVAQRRRRVFVCGQHRDDLLSQKTDSSALTITQCLQEILQAILTEGCSKLGNAPGSSALPIHSRDGAIRRMRLFGLDGGNECWPMLRENLIAALQRCQQEQKHLDVRLGESEKEPMQGDQLTGFQKESPFTLTEQSLKNALDEALEVMKLFTTSMPTRPITQAQIYTCSRAALLIAKLTHLLNQSSPAYWNSALSSLTVIEEFTDYARSTNSDLFGDVERLQAWRDFIEQAERTSESFLDIGIECFGEIFSLPSCLQGHPAPSRQAGQTITPTIRAGAANGGAGHGARSGDSKDELIVPVAKSLRGQANCSLRDDSDTYIPVPNAHISPALKARDGKGPSSDGDGDGDGAILVPMLAHALRGEGFDASEDGTGRGTPLVPVAYAVSLRGRDGGGTAELGDEVGNCLRASGGGGDKAHVLAYSTKLHNTTNNQAGKIYEEYTTALDRSSPPPALLTAMQVRRLTPEECEALQGFKRGYTAIPHRGKPAADGSRYKALGNSWATPNVQWIGRRIEAVQKLKTIRQMEIAA